MYSLCDERMCPEHTQIKHFCMSWLNWTWCYAALHFSSLAFAHWLKGLNALQNISFPTFMNLGLTWVSIEAKFLLEVKLWALIPKQIWNRSFKWGTIHPFLSRGCKVTISQSWSSEKISADRPGSNPCTRGQPNWQISYLFGDQSPRLLNDF